MRKKYVLKITEKEYGQGFVRKQTLPPSRLPSNLFVNFFPPAKKPTPESKKTSKNKKKVNLSCEVGTPCILACLFVFSLQIRLPYLCAL
jgi:hypothetical protein